MLVITRKLNDSIIIELENEEKIEIKVTEIGSQVRLGITAPKGCNIWRNELYQTILENKQAAKAAAPLTSIKDFASSIKKTSE